MSGHVGTEHASRYEKDYWKKVKREVMERRLRRIGLLVGVERVVNGLENKMEVIEYLLNTKN